MQRGAVYCNQILAGYIEKRSAQEYLFRYDDAYFADPTASAISLTLPKTQQEFTSSHLFSFFAGLLTEGINKNIQCRLLKIDENDDFSRLIKTAGEDTIGAITVKEI
ncbi:HipA N-terminal domain-containing protein [Pedobacter gandavensis]|uniref:HipA N-terminal domain-containing protein n=1 Tax=Pedobacter gandavensis TaxID=2679963 RepID=UPI00292FA38F|nr:HipA N-terminal domain-containing protein [Pedobacter gandavensis]